MELFSLPEFTFSGAEYTSSLLKCLGILLSYFPGVGVKPLRKQQGNNLNECSLAA